MNEFQKTSGLDPELFLDDTDGNKDRGTSKVDENNNLREVDDEGTSSKDGKVIYPEFDGTTPSPLEKAKRALKRVKKEKEGKVEEVAILKNKLDYAIPKPAIIYMCITSLSFGFCLSSYLSTMLKGAGILHPYYASVGIIGSGGLFYTAFRWMKYWKNKVLDHNNEEKGVEDD